MKGTVTPEGGMDLEQDMAESPHRPVAAEQNESRHEDTAPAGKKSNEVYFVFL